MLQNACVPEVMLTVSGYDPARGAVIQPEGGDVVVRHGESGIEILADPAGLPPRHLTPRGSDEHAWHGLGEYFRRLLPGRESTQRQSPPTASGPARGPDRAAGRG